MSLKSLVPFEWFEIPRNSSSPTLRVGHSANFVRSSAKIYLLGGANPSECFADFYSLSIPSKFSENFFWTKLIGENSSLKRYEHSAVVSTIDEQEKLVFFGGANTETNFNDVHALELSSQTIENWTSKENEIVSSRTHHASCSIENSFFIFSGGFQGAQAVDDSELYRFDLTKHRWSIVSTFGIPPEPRHGHVLLSLENRFLFVHGGMDKRTFFSSLYSIDLHEESPRWKQHSSTPMARAAHGGIALEKSSTLFIFGGLSRQGQALNDLWSWSKSTDQWTEIICRSNPRPRLDFAFCLVESTENSDEKSTPFLFIHGGTDTEGEVFDDSFLLRLTFDQDE